MHTVAEVVAAGIVWQWWLLGVCLSLLVGINSDKVKLFIWRQGKHNLTLKAHIHPPRAVSTSRTPTSGHVAGSPQPTGSRWRCRYSWHPSALGPALWTSAGSAPLGRPCSVSPEPAPDLKCPEAERDSLSIYSRNGEGFPLVVPMKSWLKWHAGWAYYQMDEHSPLARRAGPLAALVVCLRDTAFLSASPSGCSPARYFLCAGRRSPFCSQYNYLKHFHVWDIHLQHI